MLALCMNPTAGGSRNTLCKLLSSSTLHENPSFRTTSCDTNPSTRPKPVSLKPLDPMKPNSLFTSLAAAGAALALSSCVDPYYGSASVTTTTYEPGYVIDTLPSGYTTIDIGGTTYYSYNDTYYRPRGNRYVVVEHPQRAHRHSGPHGDRDHDGIDNWQDRRRDNAYVQRLPERYRIVTHRGTRYYVAGDTYYRPRGEGYMVVTSPF